MQGQIIPQPKSGPAPTIKIGKPESFQLKNGLKVMIVENHKLPRVSFTLTLDNAPYTEGAKKGVADLTSSLIGNGTKKSLKPLSTKKSILWELVLILVPMALLGIPFLNIQGVYYNC